MKIHGYPYRPLISEKANCGPTVTATILGISTADAIELMNTSYEKGWNGYTNVGHIRTTLKTRGIKMNKTKHWDGTYHQLPEAPLHPILMFLQVGGPWLGKGWWAEYTHTHWILVHKKMVMDANNPLLHECFSWIDSKYWDHEIMRRVVTSWKEGIGWYVRSAYEVME